MDEPEKREVLHKEIDLIQSCITRMAQNSFMIKGWYFSLIVVISAFKVDDHKFYALLVGLVSMVFYLINLQFYIYERKFRELYSSRINLRRIDNYITDLYSLSFNEPAKLSPKVYFSYAWKNKMLFFMYASICLILIFFNMQVNTDSDKKKINIEIIGVEQLLNH